MIHQHRKQGFTLVELIIVITILVILGIVVIVLIDPAEILAQSRDAQRISDLASLKAATQLVLSASTPSTTACDSTTVINATTPIAANRVYVSTPTAGSSTYNVTATLFRQLADGTGWVKMNFTGLSSGSALSGLPVDPTNAYGATGLFYRWGCSTQTGKYEYEFDAALESAKYKPGCTATGCEDKGISDGGNSTTTSSALSTGLNDRYEVGNNLNVLSATALGS